MSDRFSFISTEIIEIIQAIKSDLEIKNATTTTEITSVEIKDSTSPSKSISKIYKPNITGTTTITCKEFGVDLHVNYDKKSIPITNQL